MNSRSSLNIEDDFTLLMTATIVPVAGIERLGLTRADPATREQDYIDSLSYFIRNHPRIKHITLAESSGASLEKLKKAAEDNPHAKNVEFISLNCNEFPAELGNGYGEWRLMNQAVDASANLKRTKYFGKMTGRQWLINLTQLLETLDAPFDFAGDFCDRRLVDVLKGTSARISKVDTRFWITTVDFYNQHIRHMTRDHTQGWFYAEDAMFNGIQPLRDSRRIVSRFGLEPEYRGMAGHWNKNYGSWREWGKRRVRGTLRRLAPGLWV